MAKINTSEKDERIIKAILEKGLAIKNKPKWTVLRLALAKSLNTPEEPEPELDQINDKIGGSEYALAQVAGSGQEKDHTDAYRALLSTYHRKDLFSDEEAFRKYLQRHIRRGLKEFRTSWTETHDFHEYIYQEFLSDFDPQKTDEHQDQSKELESALNEIGVSGKIKNFFQGPRITRYQVLLEHANDLDKLKKGLEKLSFILGLKESGIFLHFSETPMLIGIDIPRKPATWEDVKSDQLRDWVTSHRDSLSIPLCLGVSVEGHPIVHDLVSAPHLFVAGTTGSGKSVALHSMLLSILLSQAETNYQLCLIDPKRVEFSVYEGLSNLYQGKICYDIEDTAMVLNALIEEMESREKLLSKNAVRDIDALHKKQLHSQRLPRLIVFVEEVADLLVNSKTIEDPLIRLAQKGRASGIHLILATQRPDSETFSGLLRSNIPSRIALTVQKSSESKIILDEVGAEKLTGRGDALVKWIGEKIKRVHGIHVRATDITACLSSLGGANP